MPHQAGALPQEAQYTDECQCEHSDHFDDEGGSCHAYGAECPEDDMHLVRTPFGTFRVCGACRRSHYSDEALAAL